MKDYNALIEANEQARREATKELYAQVKKLQNQIDAANGPFQETERALRAEWSAESAKAAEESRLAAVAKHTVTLPTDAETICVIARYFESLVAAISNNAVSRCGSIRHGVNARSISHRAPGYLLLSGVEKDGTERVYAAWNIKTGKLTGLLWVNPSRHPGDSTEAQGFIAGNTANIFEADKWSVTKPLERFLAALPKVEVDK